MAYLNDVDCAPIIRWLRNVQPEVAAPCILESGAEIADGDSLLQELHDAWLPRLLDEPQPEALAAIGRALGLLGLDDRKGIGLTADVPPDIDWAKIPASELPWLPSAAWQPGLGCAASRV